MNSDTKLSSDLLKIDSDYESKKISKFLNEKIIKNFKKKGFVFGLSGGIDSSVVAKLCVQAVGRRRVVALLMPEKESSPDTLELSKLMADNLEIDTVQIDITAVLEAVGCYQMRDDAIRSLFPSYDSNHKCKLVLPSILDNNPYRLYSIVVESPDGQQEIKRLNKSAYLGIISASNIKQRVRKLLEYYHAERLDYAVVGTPNRLEYDQGFFVKFGDGAADSKPIAHLYKSQVYEMADFFGVPKEIIGRPPTTDTYSLAQSQEEFYFSLPYRELDLCLFALNHGFPAAQVAEVTNLTVDQVERVYIDIESKRRATRYLHAPPKLVEEVAEIQLQPFGGDRTVTRGDKIWGARGSSER